jgi:selenocysteine lyase/cysteine desulfurase
MAVQTFDEEKIRRDFRITSRTIRDLRGMDIPLVYLDHAASTHPPQPVLDAHNDFLNNCYANIHRGKYYLAQVSTELFEGVSRSLADFIGAEQKDNLFIYLWNTTSALDLASHVMAGYEGITLVTAMEHHSNDLPHRRRGPVVHANVTDDGALDMEDFEMKLKKHRVKLVAVTGASNVTGVMLDIERLAVMAHERGARILIDGAQLLAHKRIKVYPNDDPRHIDFLAAAGHKAYAPFGASFLFGPRALFDGCPPYLPGGGTVVHVMEDDVLWSKAPDRHQGGTPNVVGILAMAASLNYLRSVGMERVRAHEESLMSHTYAKLKKIDGLILYGPEDLTGRLGIITFNIEGVHHHRTAAILNLAGGIATRSGCFCAHPYMNRLLGITNPLSYRDPLLKGDDNAIPGAVRASFGLYNTKEDGDRLADLLEKIVKNEGRREYADIDAHIQELVSQGVMNCPIRG